MRDARDTDHDRDLRLEVGSHIRRTHFSLAAVSLLAVAITFGYRDETVTQGRAELDLIREHGVTLLRLKPDATLGRFRELWNDFDLVISPHDARVYGSDGREEDASWPLPELHATRVDSLEECTGWFEITRTETSDLEAVLRTAEVTSLECAWAGEDELVYRQVAVTPLGAARELGPAVAAAGGREVATPGNVRLVEGRSLDDCEGWGVIPRPSYGELVPPIDRAFGEARIRCAWIDSETLVVEPVEVEVGELYLATPGDLTTPGDMRSLSDGDRTELVRAGSTRGRIDDLTRCGDQPPGNGGAARSRIREALAADLGEEVAFLCRWSLAGELFVYPIDWRRAGNRDVPLELRSRVGRPYDLAFASLLKLENLEEGDIDASMPDEATGPWRDTPLASLENVLQERQLVVDSIELAGVGLNRNLLVYGGIPLIVLLQVYFLLHFRRLREVDCSGFPWIGLYPDRLAVAVFWASVVVLPAAALWVLALQDLIPERGIAVAAALAGTLLGLAVAREIQVQRSVRSPGRPGPTEPRARESRASPRGT